MVCEYVFGQVFGRYREVGCFYCFDECSEVKLGWCVGWVVFDEGNVGMVDGQQVFCYCYCVFVIVDVDG